MGVIIDILFFIFVLPSLLFGVLLGKIYDSISGFFEPVQFLTSIWFLSVAYFLWPYQEINESVKFISIFDAVAQAKIMGASIPVVLILLSAILVLSSMIAAWHRRRSRG